MEEKSIISLSEQINESGVLVRRNKKREIKRLASYFKRFLTLIIAICLCIALIFAFPYFKGFFSKIKLPSLPNNQSPPTTDTPPLVDSPSTDTNVNTDDKQPIEYEYKINEKTPHEYIATNESGCDFDFSEPYKTTSLDEIYRQFGDEAPIVLVIHSNLRESYSDGVGYNRNSNFYSDEKNVSSVGTVLVDTLNSNGINAIQVSELYASGSIYGSKAEYEKALLDTLKRYPSIRYVFNVSRGININDDFSMNKATLKNGTNNLAQISMTSGTNMKDATENQKNNVLFSFDFAKYANSNISNLIRENKISRFDLSQDFGPTSVNLDIGEYANTFEEAKNSAEAFGTLFSEYLKQG